MEFEYKKPTLETQDLIENAKRNKDGVDALITFLVREEISSVYEDLVKRGIIPENKRELKALKEKNASTLCSLQKKKEDDPENENHIFEVDKLISEYYSQVLDLKNIEESMRNIKERNSSTSLQMDMFLCNIRVAMILKKKKMLEDNIQEAKDLCEKGCDWDRRNKFKVYEALYLLRKGAFGESSVLFSESLTTFESKEVCSYEKAVLYTIFTGLLSFERDKLKENIIFSSNILEVREKVKIAYKLAESFYQCNYGSLFVDLFLFLDHYGNDFYLKKYKDLFCREIKLKAYKQLLKSYESLSLSSMSSIFGVSEDFIEKDLIKYIVSDRLSCKIDKISMTVFVVEEERDLTREFLESGDELLRMIKKRLK